MQVLQALRSALCLGGMQDKRVLLGVSGGMDSMVLLDAMAKLAPQLGITPIAAHLDHALREQSPKDAEFVSGACAQRGMELISRRIQAQAEGGESVEMAARRVRYAFFLEAAQNTGAECLLLAHHGDDQAETLMLKLFRGAGSAGLKAMRTISPFPLPGGPVVIRPFLDLPRSDLADYCAREGIAFVEDATNSDIRFLRNRIRHELLPTLERDYGVDARMLRRTAQILSAEDEYLQQQAQDLLAQCLQEDGLSRERLATAPPALSRRALLLYLQDRGIHAGFSHVEQLRTLERGRISLPGGFVAVLLPQELRITHAQAPPPSAMQYCIQPLLPGETLLPGGVFGAETVPALPKVVPPNTAYVDADTLAGCVLRPRRAGDRYHALGAPGGKKLKDALIDRKVSHAMRQGPVLAQGAQVLWMPALPPAHAVRVTQNTRRILRLSWQADKPSS